MGAIWLTELPEVIASAGIQVVTYSGWETRSRSSGGYEKVLAIGIHHDASSIGSSDADNEAYCWRNADSRPIGALRLRRSGVVCVGAAGATNTMGQGGPLTCSRGSVPRDDGNRWMLAIEAANNGVGESWSPTMVDAYLRLCAALCDHLGLDPARDIFTHAGYCEPTCAGRKVDPAGPTPSQPSLGGTSGHRTWDQGQFRSLVRDLQEDDDLASSDEILRAIDGLDQRLTRVESWLEQIDNKIDQDRVNDGNRYKQYAAWHDDEMEAIKG